MSSRIARGAKQSRAPIFGIDLNVERLV